MKTKALFPIAVLALTLLVTFTVSASEKVNTHVNDENTAVSSERGPGSTEFESTFSLPTDGIDLQKELASRIVYPEKAIVKGIEGEVVVLCTINEEGGVSDVKILKDIGGDCALEVARAVRNMKFQPAMQNGFLRTCTLTIPVQFNLE